MPSNSSALVLHKDKIFSYLEESCLSLGVTFGSIMGLDIAAKELASAVTPAQAMEALVHGGGAGVLVGMAAVYAPPVLSKIFYHTREKQDFDPKKLLETHHDRRYRLAGLGTGLAMGLALTWGAVADNKPLKISQLVEGGKQVVSMLGEATYPGRIAQSLYTIDPQSVRFEPVAPQ